LIKWIEETAEFLEGKGSDEKRRTTAGGGTGDPDAGHGDEY